VAVYHVKDWVKAMCGRRGVTKNAEEFARNSRWILLCRDICNASKHVRLALDHRSYREAPPTVHRVAATIIDANRGSGLPVLRVYSEKYGDYSAAEVISRAIDDWENFLDREDIE
jgi:hypothetical protein